MDEVDGMGAGDRGGLGELGKLIKTSKVPIICMANDKDSQKMRGFKNHCFVNNFPKIKAQNIKGAVQKIMYVRRTGFPSKWKSHAFVAPHS
jgi:replication factor C subunit 1